MDEKGVFLVKGAAVGMGLPKVTIYSYLTRQEGKKRKEQLMQKITMSAVFIWPRSATGT